MEKGVKLKNDFLTEVIFRIDFTTISEISGDKKESADKFRKVISSEFPNLEILQQKNINLGIDLESGHTNNISNKDNFCWIFRNSICDKEISLTSNNLILNYHKGAYNGFKSFLKDIYLLISALSTYELSKINFLGLRYINEITDININKNIKEYINSSLFNTLVLDDLEKENEKLIQIFSKLDFKKEDYLLTIQYGFFNPTRNSDYEKNFILDYDCVDKNITDINDVTTKLKHMNYLIFKKFNYSVTDKYINEMGEYYGSSE